MKTCYLIIAMTCATATQGQAQTNPNGLSSAAVVTLSTLAPEVLEINLTRRQVRELNDAVGSEDGATLSDIQSIVRR